MQKILKTPIMASKSTRKQILTWWRVVPIVINLIIIGTALGISTAIGLSESFAYCTQRTTDCDFVIDRFVEVSAFGILFASLCHIFLIFFGRSKLFYLLYGLMNGFLLVCVFIGCYIFLENEFRMLS